MNKIYKELTREEMITSLVETYIDSVDLDTAMEDLEAFIRGDGIPYSQFTDEEIIESYKQLES